MPGPSSPFRLKKLASDNRHRYAIRNARLAGHYWTGSGWSPNLAEALLHGDANSASRTLIRLNRGHIRRHQPKRVFLLTLIIRAYADEGVSRGDVERYLKAALVARLDHKRCGTGPTPGSLVEVVVPVISLEEGR
jgi:hypothetical protein